MVAPAPPPCPPPFPPSPFPPDVDKVTLVATIYFADRLLTTAAAMMDQLTAAALVNVQPYLNPDGVTYEALLEQVRFWELRKRQATAAMAARDWPIPEFPTLDDWIARAAGLTVDH